MSKQTGLRIWCPKCQKAAEEAAQRKRESEPAAVELTTDDEEQVESDGGERTKGNSGKDK